jgi:hypothetical protein
MKEQRVHIKFCLKWGKDGMKTLEMLEEAVGEQTAVRTHKYLYFSGFPLFNAACPLLKVHNAQDIR